MKTPLSRLFAIARRTHQASPDSPSQEALGAYLNEAELISCTRPPTPFVNALLEKDEQGMAQLLDLLFACHAKVDNVEDLSPWYECEVAWNVKTLYERGLVTSALQGIAPTWEDAIRLSEEWLTLWRHNCGEFERWTRRGDELGAPSALSFLRGMMIYRCPQLRKALILGSDK